MNQTPLLQSVHVGGPCSWNTLGWGPEWVERSKHTHMWLQSWADPSALCVLHILLGKCQRRTNIIDLSVCEEFLPSSRQIYKE